MFRSNRGRGAHRSRPRKRSHTQSVGNASEKPRYTTVACFCLADRSEEKVPNTVTRQILHKAGLGLKKMKFCLDDNESQVVEKLTDESGFPQLKTCGGFEILQCLGNCRNLTVVNCAWSMQELKAHMGSQSKMYLRPIQKNLSTKPIHDVPTSNLKEMCHGCKEEFPTLELRDHLKYCTHFSSSSESDTDSPAPISDNILQRGTTTDVITSDIIQPETTIDLTSTAIQQDTTTDLTTTNAIGHEATDSTSKADDSTQRNQDLSVSDVVGKTVDFCKTKNVSNPVEILKFFQSKMVTGRKLDIDNPAECPKGSTNFITVNRSNILITGFNEISIMENLRDTLEVKFYDE
ncbi:uncharacterized protein LOC102806255, partial [Saccoglossus kowalevskii]|uniref:Uncharacterized protein LOC102806255 n=1 Tax=Saccoglossus kowalevskii TaxID=10224 RepID=A0ABM0MRW9_SACKO